MYGRHRTVGNGYRSNAVGMGIPSSQVSPEAPSSIRNHARGGYNSDFNRSFNPSIGRGTRKSFQSPLPPTPPSPPPPPVPLLHPKRGELFIEAGRLAVEYLVSHGLLPMDVLPSTKCQNYNSLKSNALVDLHERLAPGPQAGGENSALSPKGSVSKNYTCEGRRLGSSRTYGSDSSQRNGSDQSSPNKPNGSSSQDLESNCDNLSAAKVVKEEGDKFSLTNSASKADGSHGLQEENEKDQPSDNDVVAGFHSTRDLPIEPTDGVAKSSDDTDAECGVSTDDLPHVENQNAGELGELSVDQERQEEAGIESNNHLDLLKLCNSAKVPTKTRSSLMNKSPIKDALLSVANASGPASQSIVSIQDNSINGLKDGSLSSLTCGSFSLGSEDCGHRPTTLVGDEGRLSSGQILEPENYTDTRSSLDSTVINKQGSPEALSQLGSFSSVAIDRGGKRALGDDNTSSGSKKAKEWISVAANQDNFHLSNAGVKWTSSLSSVGNSLLLQCTDEPSAGYAEEKQLFPSSFKICDLNLLEGSEVTEAHDNSIQMHSSISVPNKEVSVDIDLSISNKGGVVNEYDKFGSIGRDVELIDLEGDSLQEGESFSNSNTELQSELTTLEAFQNHAQDLSANTHTQDGYGLMISELIGTDMQDCSSVQLRPEINPLHSEMSLHPGEGLLNDEDHIYMSLGEIPLSFLHAWEQPTQDYEKQF
ncbi:hypothetical protein Dimus_014411 [Dionaea muscipula]